MRSKFTRFDSELPTAMKTTNQKPISTFLALFLAPATLWAGSLEFGHVRARSRGWAEEDAQTAEAKSMEAAEETTFKEISEPIVEPSPVEDRVEPKPMDESELEEPTERVAKMEPQRKGPTIGERFKATVKRGADLILIGGKSKKGPLRVGYLTKGEPSPLRFSDVDPVGSRPPAPALPEFSVTGSGYMPYLLETALPEDAMNDPEYLSEIVIELEPHEIVSGKIETRVVSQEDKVEHFELDEHRSTALRPEEVLIYFETDTVNGEGGAIIPFSPANPTSTTIKSSATLKKE